MIEVETCKKYIDRIYSRIYPEPNSGCWIWAGAHDKKGYGNARFPVNGVNKVQNVHRIVYVIEKGEIPKGYDLDHLCRNPACVNPDHLEVVNRSENVKRGKSPELSRERMQNNLIAQKQNYFRK